MKPFRIFIILVFISMAGGAAAQDFQAPDLKQIKKDIKDRKSSCFYGTLLHRFGQGDTSMTTKEKRHLYYGYCFRKEYEPYDHNQFEDSTRKILVKDSLTTEDYRLLLAYTDSALAKSPFNLPMLQYRRYAAGQSGYTDIKQLADRQINILLDAMLSTGDGKTAATAFWVISIPDEYFLINAAGLEFGGNQSLTEGPCDCLTVKPNEWDIKGLYFNVSISMAHMERMFRRRK